MKRRCLLLVLVACLSLSGCASDIKKEVEVFNQNTEMTINLYEDIKNAREGKTEDLIKAIAEGTELDVELGKDVKASIQDAKKLLNSSEFADTIEPTPFIKTDNFYTRLGYKTITQVVTFSYQGQAFLLEILWLDNVVLDTLHLEVTSGE